MRSLFQSLLCQRLTLCSRKTSLRWSRTRCLSKQGSLAQIITSSFLWIEAVVWALAAEGSSWPRMLSAFSSAPYPLDANSPLSASELYMMACATGIKILASLTMKAQKILLSNRSTISILTMAAQILLDLSDTVKHNPPIGTIKLHAASSC